MLRERREREAELCAHRRGPAAEPQDEGCKAVSQAQSSAWRELVEVALNLWGGEKEATWVKHAGTKARNREKIQIME